MKKTTVALAISMLAAHAYALKVGDQVPEISAMTSAGSKIEINDLPGKWVVLYFYPKSFTPGCTKEACSLRDGYAELEKLGAVLFGSSFDSLETQKKFKAEHSLPFDLLADDNKAVATAFDAVGLGGFMPQRKTFIISPKGKIAAVIDDVDVSDHDAQVLKQLQQLQSPEDGAEP